jgi:dTDP-4-amino-4,6-dideoxygalactose transaminase
VRVPFLELARQTALVRDEIDDALDRVLTSGRFVLEQEVEGFEKEWAAYCGAEHAVGVASGTDALALALQAVGVRAGDEVVTAANTCVPTVAAIEQAGAAPVLADVDPGTFTLDLARVEEALTERTRALVPVHLYGRVADMEPLLELARTRKLLVVEDCAQAHGAEYEGRRAGALGDAAAWSFYPTKNLGAIGDAGAVTTSDPETAERVRLLRNYGEQERFRHVARGRNSRLDAVQAAVLRAKLPHLEEWNERRREIAAAYGEALADTDVAAPGGDGHVYHLYVVRTPRREELREHLFARGIGTAIHYPVPIHLQPAYTALTPAGRDLTASERLSRSILSIPLNAALTDDEVDYVAEALASA